MSDLGRMNLEFGRLWKVHDQENPFIWEYTPFLLSEFYDIRKCTIELCKLRKFNNRGGSLCL